jgi:hypothetical protein
MYVRLRRPFRPKGVVQVMSRIAVFLAANALILGLVVAPAQAAEVTVEPVTWQLSSTSCSELPSGTTVNGSGTLRVLVNTTARREVVIQHAKGTATDQAGNTYHWIYSNEANTVGSTTRVVDHFSLSGPGPARLSNGFVAVFRGDELDLIHAHGDPIDFETFEAHCDPL